MVGYIEMKGKQDLGCVGDERIGRIGNRTEGWSTLSCQ